MDRVCSHHLLLLTEDSLIFANNCHYLVNFLQSHLLTHLVNLDFINDDQYLDVSNNTFIHFQIEHILITLTRFGSEGQQKEQM